MLPVVSEVIGAWQIISRNKLRSGLTTLGVIIGIMAVVVIMSVGAGAQSLILNQIRSLGSNLVGILPGQSDDHGPPAAVFGIVITTLVEGDARALMNGQLPHIRAVTAYVRGSATVTGADGETDTTFVGVMGTYPEVEDFTLSNGRFFTEDENKAGARVAVLGSKAASDLFGEQNPIGRQIKIKRTNFNVLGVVAERGASAFQNQDDQIFVPLAAAQKLLLGINYVNFIRAKVDEPENVAQAMEDIKGILRERHGIEEAAGDDFSVRSTNQGIDVLTGVTNALRFFLAAIAAISLVVGGIGIMNIMLAAVEERTREIGLRLAIGATRRHILRQFLVETSAITLGGGVIGVILGALLSLFVAAVARNLGYGWDFVISPVSIILGLLVSISIGLIFGLSPARRASKLNPIEALRYE